MDSTVITQIDLFGAEVPSFDKVKTLAEHVNASELSRIAFTDKVKENSGKPLQAGIGSFIVSNYTDALKSLQKADDSKEKFVYLGYSQTALGQYDEAIKSFDKAAKAKADSLMVSLAKAEAYRKAAQPEKAEKELKACSNFEKVSADYHCQLGKLHDSQGQYEEAISNYETAIELDENHREATFLLAFACDLHGDDEAAMDYYKQIARTAPVHVNTLLNLAVMYEDKGDYDRALTCVETVLQSHPNHKRADLFREDIESSTVMYYDEEKEKRKDRQNKILEIPISDFELSVRSRNCLKKMNIDTLGDLLKISEAELLSYKNLGETSLVEIKKILDIKGLTLGMSVDDEDAILDENNINAAASEEILNKPVEDMELSVRAKRALGRLGTRTVGELISKTEAELLGCKNFGVTSLNEIKERLISYGVNLRTLD